MKTILEGIAFIIGCALMLALVLFINFGIFGGYFYNFGGPQIDEITQWEIDQLNRYGPDPADVQRESP